MRKRLIGIVAIILVAQAALLLLLFGKVGKTTIERTPIPTLIQATMPAAVYDKVQANYDTGQCKIPALDLIGAWVKAGKPQTSPFDFQSTENALCQAEFEKDVLPLFNQPNIWFAGSISCSTCHAADAAGSAARLSLADYEGILAGSGRKSSDVKGQDILGDGTQWEKAKLYVMIATRLMPMGRPQDSPEKGPFVRVGVIK